MKYGSVAILLAAIGGWSTIRLEAPIGGSSRTNGLAPVRVAVVPASIPEANPGRNGDGSADKPVARVKAEVHACLRNGHLVPTSGTELEVGDVVYLDCTPLDADGNPTHAHGPLQAWLVSGDAAHTIVDASTFNPDLRVSGPGAVAVACRVDDITSPARHLSVHQ